MITQERPEYHYYARQARAALKKAVRSGAIRPEAFCERCGSPGVEAHHPDYSKPYAVTWLCKTCHGRIPKRQRRVKIDIAQWPHRHVLRDHSIGNPELNFPCNLFPATPLDMLSS